MVDREDGGWVEPSSFDGLRQSNPRLHRAKATSAVSAWFEMISSDGGMLDGLLNSVATAEVRFDLILCHQ